MKGLVMKPTMEQLKDIICKVNRISSDCKVVICGKTFVSKYDFDKDENSGDIERDFHSIKEIAVRFTEEGEKDEVRIYVEEQ
jgi:hypothetical protein